MTLGLLNCGGTITELYRPGGIVARLKAQDLIEIAGLAERAACVPYDIEPVDSAELNFASVCKARDTIRADRQSEAFVLCCGTDAMEDYAYAASLLFDRDRPVVITGSALPGGQGSDGVSNLREASLLASTMVAGSAPLIVFAGQVFDPAITVKVWPQAIQPFGPDTARRGTIEAGLVTMTSSTESGDSFSELDAADLNARVALVSEMFGDIAGFPDVSDLDGLVIAGKGAGGFSASTEDHLRRAVASIPVVLSTRCPTGFRMNPAIAKHDFSRATKLGLSIEGYEGLNAAKARIRLIAQLGRAKRSRQDGA